MSRQSTQPDTRAEPVCALRYSSAYVGDGGMGSLSMFTVPKGQEIPRLAGRNSGEVLPPYWTYFTDATTSQVQAGQFGNALGDFTATHLGIYIHRALPEIVDVQQRERVLSGQPDMRVPMEILEPGSRLRDYVNGLATRVLGHRRLPLYAERTIYRPTLKVTDYGATPDDLHQIQQMMSFELKVSSKTAINGPIRMFSLDIDPLGRGHDGEKVGAWGKVLDTPIQIGRQDQIEGILAIRGPGQALKLAPTSDGSPRLVLVTAAMFGRATYDLR